MLCWSRMVRDNRMMGQEGTLNCELTEIGSVKAASGREQRPKGEKIE